ncbi:hypothetical protein PoB_003167600 [Plakobranchus ocellatus]|uniref:Uncharacterized protein n=1 Tax=Plakobranchus ocellatus TaxID=259542 RepID=A0AAV4A1S9_9GAST|nr:hypothetical protein PoB_003167600 [Plakobranchus ocellatus]
MSAILIEKDKIGAAVNKGIPQHEKQQFQDFLMWTKPCGLNKPKYGYSNIMTHFDSERRTGTTTWLDTECKLSGGWLDRIKLRHGIIFKTVWRGSFIKRHKHCRMGEDTAKNASGFHFQSQRRV